MVFGADERGVSAVVGATLIFGFLVIFFALYQATVVPNQNEQVEFDHSQAVQRDVVDVRNTILETAENGRDGYVSVSLGTTYPARTIAINPPPVTGTLRTTDNQNLFVSNDTIETGEVCPGEPVTRFLVYEPSYNVYTDGPDLVYENSVIYENFSTGSIVASDQTLVQGSTVSIVTIQRPYSRSGFKTVTFEPKIGKLNTTTLDDPVIEVPTRLDNDTWEELLGDELESGEDAYVTQDGDLRLELGGEYEVSCTPVGANDLPTGGARADANPSIIPPGSGGGPLLLDPTGTVVPTAPTLDPQQT